MTFKLMSTATIYTGPGYTPRVPHEVFSRERVLQPGETLRAQGQVAIDEEAKTGFELADVIITVLDEERIEVSWRPVDGKRQSNKGYYNTIIIDGEKRQREDGSLLETGYQYIIEDTIPNTFTLLDKLRLPLLIRLKMMKFKDVRNAEYETHIKYEQTLSPQSRK